MPENPIVAFRFIDLCEFPTRYNDKADVFSFGVLMFEIFSRTTLLRTHGRRDPCELVANTSVASHLKSLLVISFTAQFTAMVAQGFRLKKPDGMDQEVFDLIEWCWSNDPNQRPKMSDVIIGLKILIKKTEDAANEEAVVKRGCGCVVS